MTLDHQTADALVAQTVANTEFFTRSLVGTRDEFRWTVTSTFVTERGAEQWEPFEYTSS
jgi:hypothetical protein